MLPPLVLILRGVPSCRWNWQVFQPIEVDSAKHTVGVAAGRYLQQAQQSLLIDLFVSQKPGEYFRRPVRSNVKMPRGFRKPGNNVVRDNADDQCTW